MITKREFLKVGTACLGGMALHPSLSLGAETADDTLLPLPTRAQMSWQDCEIGLVYHFDLSIAAGNFAGNNTHRERFDPKRYNPKKLDTDQWIEAAKACGAKYAVFTATHFNGFMQWQSDLYPYGVKQATWRNGKGDVVGDFVASCRKAGIRPGIYFSTHRNVYQTVWGHYVDWGKGRKTEKQKAYNQIAEAQLTELCSRYGELVQIWYDAGTKLPHEDGPNSLPIFEKYQPNSVFYHSSRRSDVRWVGNEHGHVPYPCWATMPKGKDGSVGHNHTDWKPNLSQGVADGSVWAPGMADVPLRNHNWFWKPGQDNKVWSLQELMKKYYGSVGHNCNLLLGEVVTSEGLVPDHDINRLAEFGKEIQRRFGKSIAETSGTGDSIELKLPTPQRINHMIAMEDIAEGERVREYTLEGRMPGGEWQPLCSGECIGHKRIQTFTDVDVAAVRLKISKARAKPHLRRLAVFNVT
ncbi:Alpha-L-fucosidase [Planctomycetes bacterium CA13]|uniref:alpha-L-fucosidase n=1 Tax=Novipirellula herctigrandis TaxID=2527986 RepID=A0A5C5Z2T7_9BACT|nr:Alpha-L-fucosidase [Planctomycetes bacterium CA13]